ncbi:telomere length regulation protein TEL2 homolog [Prunus yedoensis var. nudiflora]|uniref:Telomere length regulation protein TEL2 homolog n=1 Tax=Prunus yedoensis var. nudiflora TaxID=2094558 RepID=A0A314ULA0_PRUYE|nr:telomere length regulation protein TEL2 homolog [Prunus yedoensis var. nudiflora]
MDNGPKERSEVEAKVLDMVGEVISNVKKAKHVNQVICALHSLAILLFPLDASLLSGAIDERCRELVLGAEAPSADERNEWWQVFYGGAAFSTFARVLLIDIASDWLACFPFSARKHVYDVFFVNGLATEVVQTLVPCLHQSGSDDLDVKAVHSNTERLLILCLLENNGVLQMAREFSSSSHSEDYINENLKPAVSRVAQIVASIPDKAQLRAPTSLSSHFFFKQVTIQLLSLAEERNMNLLEEGVCLKSDMNGTLQFVGEIFSRVCRRGSVDVLLSEIIPRVLSHVRSLLSLNIDPLVSDVFESNPSSQFWLNMIQAMKDSYAVERISEHLLHQLATERLSDVEAYWILWLLFHRVSKYQISVRAMFADKFLLWKVFPVRCLRWILQFAVLECPPESDSLAKGHNTQNFLGTLQHLVAVWSSKEFVQSASTEQQIYVSAAVGLSLEKMSKEELDETKDVLHSILKGVSCRLESPNNLIRKMASSVALAFSKVIDPKNPLYLDDSYTGDTIDWEFGLSTPEKGTPERGIDKTETSTTSVLEKGFTHKGNDEIASNGKSKNKKITESKLVDPDEIIDPVTLNYESASDEDDNDDASENSDVSSDSSLQPYDLADDDTDLKRKFSQLVDVVGALRKSDDADGVENALAVAEKLVRASPDELKHVASDLVRTLVQVRCSDLAVEGEEDSAEDKRQRALVALLVTCPLESLETLNKLLYSPNVDVSQRIMILDVMTEAAQELAHTKIIKPKQARALIATTSETQAWFLPSDIGPPGSGPWKEISESRSLLNWTNRYERELPSKPGQIKRGKTRQWSLRSANKQEAQLEWSHNKFPVYAAAFMLPAMQGFDKKRQGVDLLDRDFIVLGKLIYMLGVCMKCAAMHPEASALAAPLLDMLRSREVCLHKEAYVRRAVLFAASCVLLSLHPSYVATSLVEGNVEISNGLEWVRTWALQVAESDNDRECYTMAMACLQLHAEMALQASRALESPEATSISKNVGLPSSLSKGTIIIPQSSVKYH